MRRIAKKHSDLITIVSAAAIMFVVAVGIYRLDVSFHAPMQARILGGPVSI